MALDAIAERAAADGLGPVPAQPRRDARPDRPAACRRDEDGPLWGYADAGRRVVVPARYAQAQPFPDGLAWVRRPDGAGGS